MQKQVTVAQGCVAVQLKGRMDEEDAGVLGLELQAYVEQGYSTYHIDMSDLYYIDSAGLSVLIAINKRALKLGGDVMLTGLKGTVEELFEVTRLKKIFKTDA